MTESELPSWLQHLFIALQIIALVVFIYLVWPLIKSENWKAKFIDNKTARSIIIVFILILTFVWGLSAFFGHFFPIQELK
ncbi:hypothetical protein [Thiomicrorhabdus sp.]|uniref:hypothetical protein n=1 Tax=Thiomicrorhabdus sp. TaxID=2039724 RepID=UPI002AA71ACD|nr:hypothetical protein [Thiomicrorhabdus sp.]